MQVKIKDDNLLQEICKRINKSPGTIVNELVESLDFLPDEIVSECRDVSFRDILMDYFCDSISGKELNQELSAILGEYRYYVYKMEIDFLRMGFNFVIYFKHNEKRINIDEIGLGITPVRIEMLILRDVEGVKLPSRTVKVVDDTEFVDYPRLRSLEEELNAKIRDPCVWHDFMGGAEFDQVIIKDISLSSDGRADNSVVIGLTVKEENLANIPKLEHLNKVLDLAEKMVRDGLR
ncbi:MAG: hypothetical protein HMLIMOIP_000260 [Candidatus Nitrosomirales archaeon]|jgi:hypothetical protein